jgi:hypothetical protein
MAFCVKCGGQLVEGAQFCTSCGVPAVAGVSAAPAQAPAAPVARTRSPLVWVIPIIVLGVIALGAGGWFAFGILSGGSESGRARAQAEAVADFMEGYTLGDFEMIRSVVPEELHDILATEDVGWGDSASVVREWDGDILRWTATSEEYDWEDIIEITADGGKDRGIVTTIEIDGESETELIVEREGQRWVIVEIDGMPIRDAVGTTDESGEEGSAESGADTEDTDGVTTRTFPEAEAAECMANQEIIESAVWDYADQGWDTVDLAGDLSWDHPILADGYLEVPPSCASAPGAYYYIARDGTTSCPTGEHGYYLNEQ